MAYNFFFLCLYLISCQIYVGFINKFGQSVNIGLKPFLPNLWISWSKKYRRNDGNDLVNLLASMVIGPLDSIYYFKKIKENGESSHMESF